MHSDHWMLEHHAPFLVMPIAPTAAPNPVSAPSVVPDQLNALAEVPKVAGVKIAHQISTDEEAKEGSSDGEANRGLVQSALTIW